jgi:hypothetical protein
MTTILSHNGTVPLWGFIVIISVGSVVILGTVFFALRYYIKHHDSDGDSIRNDPETVRRVTVRRGRIVPQSHYMSLTGSRFGVGAFDELRSGARSKSPFDWWNNVHGRSNSQMSETKKVNQTPEPILTGDSRIPVPSPLRNASFESMSEKPPAYTFPSKPALAHQSPHQSPRTTNFSRPALGMRPSAAASVTSSLPQIIEASPHQSMISSRQSKQSVFSEKASAIVSDVPHSPASLTGFGSRSNAEISSTMSREPSFEHHPAVNKQLSQARIPRPSPSINSSRAKSLPRSPRPADGFESAPTSRRPSTNRPTEIRIDVTPEPDRRPSLPHSPRRSSSTLNSKRSSTYRGPGDADNTTGQLSTASLQALPQLSPTTNHSQAYWESRQDLQPVRRKSQKGNVLRKKSLLRAERTSWVE